MYPAYKLQDALDEYAISFFALLNEGYRIKARNYQMLANISDLPQLRATDRSNIYRTLEWAATDPSDILKESSQGSSEADIKKALGG